jgi:formylglycine-generating enzyme required for sulfatase activity
MWNTSLGCAGTTSANYASWTPSASTQESWPINCASWYEAYAFCIWDGGFLASEIEWDNAAIGGTEGRFFPWGSDPVSLTRALYGATRLEPVGQRPAGNGRWGHADLLGMLTEFVYDVRVTQYAANCADCARDDVNGERTTRGQDFRVAEGTLTSFGGLSRSGMYVGDRNAATGFRCARTGKL